MGTSTTPRREEATGEAPTSVRSVRSSLRPRQRRRSSGHRAPADRAGGRPPERSRAAGSAGSVTATNEDDRLGPVHVVHVEHGPHITRSWVPFRGRSFTSFTARAGPHAWMLTSGDRPWLRRSDRSQNGVVIRVRKPIAHRTLPAAASGFASDIGHASRKPTTNEHRRCGRQRHWQARASGSACEYEYEADPAPAVVQSRKEQSVDLGAALLQLVLLKSAAVKLVGIAGRQRARLRVPLARPNRD